jgi:hypothetical protein
LFSYAWAQKISFPIARYNYGRAITHLICFGLSKFSFQKNKNFVDSFDSAYNFTPDLHLKFYNQNIPGGEASKKFLIIELFFKSKL